jgi:hypothetical protein
MAMAGDKSGVWCSRHMSDQTSRGGRRIGSWTVSLGCKRLSTRDRPDKAEELGRWRMRRRRDLLLRRRDTAIVSVLWWRRVARRGDRGSATGPKRTSTSRRGMEVDRPRSKGPSTPGSWTELDRTKGGRLGCCSRLTTVETALSWTVGYRGRSNCLFD